MTGEPFQDRAQRQQRLDQWLRGVEQSQRPSISTEGRIYEEYGTRSIPVLCLRGLLRLHILSMHSLQESRPRLRVGHFATGSDLVLDQDRNQGFRKGLFKQPSALPVAEMQHRWSLLRHEVVSCREHLLSLPNFVSCIIKPEDEAIVRVYQETMGEYEIQVKRLEMTESLAKDEIGMMSSAITTEMAQISIKESKRVMLCELGPLGKQFAVTDFEVTLLAFVFLPISLAGTIFGMNVQQINESGHDIKVFITTSLVLSVSTMILWAMAYAFMSIRRAATQEFLESNKDPFNRRTWKERIAFVGLSQDRLKFWLGSSEGLNFWLVMHSIEHWRDIPHRMYEIYIIPLREILRSWRPRWSARPGRSASSDGPALHS